MTLLDQIAASTSPGPDYEAEGATVPDGAAPPVRLVAFYLPQFHAIPENDAWWGEGFTEWTNVTKSVPRFDGHHQPRLPGALGFYDATSADVLRRQAAMARRHGVAAFCFHHYWFGGRRLLHRPIETLLAHPDIDMPFCVNWANESWTRRWDGHEKSVLLAQTHSPEDDVAFARSLEPLFRDRRYLRIDGRPFLMLYRPDLLPDAAATVARWRAHFTEAGLGDPYVAMAQIYDNRDPGRHGMDAAVGFPPFWAGGGLPVRSDLHLFDPRYRGEVRDYRAMAEATAAGYARDRRTFPGVCPSWDNEARRPGRGTCFTGSTPAVYGRWLRAACDASIRAFPPSERLVFVNAWNEWAEGAYLEPDRRFGYAYLAETARVLNALPAPDGLAQDAAAAPARLASRAAAKRPHRRLRRLARQALNRLADKAEDAAWLLRGI